MIMANDRQPMISCSCLTVIISVFVIEILTTYFFEVKIVLAISGGYGAMLTGRFDFQHGGTIISDALN